MRCTPRANRWTLYGRGFLLPEWSRRAAEKASISELSASGNVGRRSWSVDGSSVHCGRTSLLRERSPSNPRREPAHQPGAPTGRRHRVGWRCFGRRGGRSLNDRGLVHQLTPLNTGDFDHRLGKLVRCFLRHVVSDALQDLVRVLSGEFARIGSPSAAAPSKSLADGDRGHGDDGTFEEASAPDHRIPARPWPGSDASGSCG
jgi:hypothetical protein